MLRSLILLCALVPVLACPSPRPGSPPLAAPDGGVGLADGGPVVAPDSGSEAVADAGTPAPPVIPPATMDAGYTPEVPEPPEEDRCANACGQRECAEDCYAVCTMVTHGVAGEERDRFVACVEARGACGVEGCIPPENVAPVTEECERICRARENENEANCVDLPEGDQPCRLACNASLSVMTPAARQAWLRCNLERCPDNPEVDCDVPAFLSPNPSQACLDMAEHQLECDRNETQGVWAMAHERCEFMRSPAEQPELGGRHWVDCLANTNTCGDWVYIECLTAMEAGTGRGGDGQRICAPAAACGDDAAYQCRIWAQGLTGFVGGYALQEMDECLQDQAGNCEGVGGCLAQLVDRPVMSQEDPCIAECNRCGLPGSVCGGMCVRIRNSLSVQDADELHQCMADSACGIGMLGACTRQVLPRAGGVCTRFLRAAQEACPQALEAPADVYVPWCAMAGPRTGYLSEAALLDCVDRVPCLDEDFNPFTVCLQGMPR